MYLPASAVDQDRVCRLELLLLEERLIAARNALYEYRDKKPLLKAKHPVEEDVLRSIEQNLDAIGMQVIELTGVGECQVSISERGGSIEAGG